MKIISEQLIRSLNISLKECVAWIYESFAMKQDTQLPVKISVHPVDYDFFTSIPCLFPQSGESVREPLLIIQKSYNLKV